MKRDAASKIDSAFGAMYWPDDRGWLVASELKNEDPTSHTAGTRQRPFLSFGRSLTLLNNPAGVRSRGSASDIRVSVRRCQRVLAFGFSPQT
jgi:hypothetical protein